MLYTSIEVELIMLDTELLPESHTCIRPFSWLGTKMVLFLLIKMLNGGLPIVLPSARVIPFAFHVADGQNFGRLNDAPKSEDTFQRIHQGKEYSLQCTH